MVSSSSSSTTYYYHFNVYSIKSDCSIYHHPHHHQDHEKNFKLNLLNIADNVFVMMNTSAGVRFEKLPFRCHHLERRTVCTSKQSGSRWQVSILDHQYKVNHHDFIFKTIIKTVSNPRYHLWTSIELSDSRCSLDCHPIGSPSAVHR